MVLCGSTVSRIQKSGELAAVVSPVLHVCDRKAYVILLYYPYVLERTTEKKKLLFTEGKKKASQHVLLEGHLSICSQEVFSICINSSNYNKNISLISPSPPQ